MSVSRTPQAPQTIYAWMVPLHQCPDGDWEPCVRLTEPFDDWQGGTVRALESVSPWPWRAGFERPGTWVPYAEAILVTPVYTIKATKEIIGQFALIRVRWAAEDSGAGADVRPDATIENPHENS